MVSGKKSVQTHKNSSFLEYFAKALLEFIIEGS